MRLTELDPQFLNSGGHGITNSITGEPVPLRVGVGLRFNCPCGCGAPGYVPFSNPLDGGPAVDTAHDKWERTGDTYDTITLTPSILKTKWQDKDGNSHGCGWHGYITNGEIIEC